MNKPGLAPLFAVLFGLGSLIYGVTYLTSSPQIKYGTIYQVTDGFYSGCTGRAIRVMTLGTVVLNNVVCIYDSLDIELSLPASSLVIYVDPSDNPYRTDK